MTRIMTGVWLLLALIAAPRTGFAAGLMHLPITIAIVA